VPRKSRRPPSKASLKEISEVDFTGTRVRKNLYARKVASGGLEALRDFRRRHRRGMDELWRQAEVCRVTRVMRPYLEALGGWRIRGRATSPVRQRLLDLSRARPELGDFGTVLARYAIERVLYRLSASRHRDRFVLKGAQLFVLWMPVPHRSTRDVDFLGRGDNTPAALLEVIRDVIAVPDPEDGLVFDATTVRGRTHTRPDRRRVRRRRQPPPQMAEFPSLHGLSSFRSGRATTRTPDPSCGNGAQRPAATGGQAVAWFVPLPDGRRAVGIPTW
jgi:hypothetical protein